VHLTLWGPDAVLVSWQTGGEGAWWLSVSRSHLTFGCGACASLCHVFYEPTPAADPLVGPTSDPPQAYNASALAAHVEVGTEPGEYEATVFSMTDAVYTYRCAEAGLTIGTKSYRSQD
jgi:hypothetical protein